MNFMGCKDSYTDLEKVLKNEPLLWTFEISIWGRPLGVVAPVVWEDEKERIKNIFYLVGIDNSHIGQFYVTMTW